MTVNSVETHKNNENEKKNEMNACEYIRYIGSFCIVNLLVLVAMIGVGNSWCVLKLHPAGNFVMLFAALILLAYIEALHYGKCYSLYFSYTSNIEYLNFFIIYYLFYKILLFYYLVLIYIIIITNEYYNFGLFEF